jgi:hypothetical protein
MMPCDTNDPIAEELKRLTLAPDAARAIDARARCRKQFRRSRPPMAAAAAAVLARVIAPLAVGGFCILYFVALVITALAFYGLVYSTETAQPHAVGSRIDAREPGSLRVRSD